MKLEKIILFRLNLVILGYIMLNMVIVNYIWVN